MPRVLGKMRDNKDNRREQIERVKEDTERSSLRP